MSQSNKRPADKVSSSPSWVQQMEAAVLLFGPKDTAAAVKEAAKHKKKK